MSDVKNNKKINRNKKYILEKNDEKIDIKNEKNGERGQKLNDKKCVMIKIINSAKSINK